MYRSNMVIINWRFAWASYANEPFVLIPVFVTIIELFSTSWRLQAHVSDLSTSGIMQDWGRRLDRSTDSITFGASLKC